MAGKILNLCVCVPSNGSWSSDFGRNLVTATAEFMTYRPLKAKGWTGKIYQTLTADSSMLVRNRHDLVRASMKAGASHIMLLDADMKFPKDLFARWIELDKPVIAANATYRRVPVKPIARGFDSEEPIDSRERSGLEAVRQVGCAVMMLKREVFVKIRPPYFMMDWVPDLGGYVGEDIYFCQLLQENGFEVLVDHDVSPLIEHMGSYSYGYKDIGVLQESELDVGARERFKSGAVG
jgi:hypothetical protein